MRTSWSSTTSLKEGQDLCACKTKHIFGIGCGLVGQRLACLERKKADNWESEKREREIRAAGSYGNGQFGKKEISERKFFPKSPIPIISSGSSLSLSSLPLFFFSTSSSSLLYNQLEVRTFFFSFYYFFKSLSSIFYFIFLIESFRIFH